MLNLFSIAMEDFKEKNIVEPDKIQDDPYKEDKKIEHEPSNLQVIADKLGCMIVKSNTGYEVYLEDHVTSTFADGYNILIPVLEQAKETDIIRIYLSNAGGAVNTGMRIVTAIKNSKAKIEAVAVSGAASMAAIIFAICPYQQMVPGSYVMFHSISSFIGSNIYMLEEYAYNISDINNAVMQEIKNKGIITEDEYKLIVEEQKDLYLSYETMLSRITPLTKFNFSNLVQ